VTLAGDLRITLFTGWSDTIGATYNIILNSSSFATTGRFSNDTNQLTGPGTITSTDGNHIFAVNYAVDLDGVGGANDVQLTLVSIPKPASWTLLAGSLCMALGWPRFRRRRG
jgi:hypothetical protein